MAKSSIIKELANSSIRYGNSSEKIENTVA